ncbi:MAG: N-acyl homoserine lactonase family protein [Chloroflexi bacterium]|nr:N-acyl homoserine lactonase family protein [Chloroflexota bacterium]
MAQLRIRPLDVGTMRVDKAFLTYMANFGVPLVSASMIWYVEGAQKKILVDTGPADPEWAAKYHAPLERRPEQHPVAALESIGVRPEDIEIVVITHLHWDHSFNNALFPNAKFLVQHEELCYAIDPLPVHYRAFEAMALGMTPHFVHTPLTTVEGDLPICDGVSIVFLPGHTPGSQGVLVETESGPYLIAGDAVPLFDNWEGLPPYQPHLPPSIHVDVADCYRTFKRIESIADFVLPGHDARVLERKSYP